MTTKRAKKVVVYLASLLVIFTLITTCLLGNTFAKYATGTISNADSLISYWNVANSGDLVDNTTTTFSSDSGLSPAVTGLTPTTTTYYNSTAVKQIATIKIDSTTEVNVSVYLSATALDFYNSSSQSISNWGSGIVSYGSPTKNEVSAALTLHVMWVKSGSNSAPTITLSNKGTYFSGASGTEGSQYGQLTIDGNYAQLGSDWTTGSITVYYYIYCWVTWKTDYTATDYSSTDSNGVYYADLLDTWIAENVSSVQTTISVMSIQNSANN